MTRARVLIVDDSAVMRNLLRAVVATDPALEVAGTASDGLSALNTLDALRPDLVLLDVEMPIMDGLATLKQIRERLPRLPIIMCSSLTQRGAHVTIEALAAGASDYVAKPTGQDSREAAMKALAQDLLPKIRALIPRRSAASALEQRPSKPVLFPRTPLVRTAAPPQAQIAPAVVVIGVSTGGPAALDLLLPMLPASFRLPVLVVQHMPELFTRQLSERLNTRCRLRVCEAQEGLPILAGTVYIARGNWHMQIAAAVNHAVPPTLHLMQEPPVNHCRPAVDVLFHSAAQVYGAATLAVMLTGMGHDGLDGCRALHAAGATIIAQDEATSTVWGMPGSVAHAGLAHSILPLAAIAPEMQRLAGITEASTLREKAV